MQVFRDTTRVVQRKRNNPKKHHRGDSSSQQNCSSTSALGCSLAAVDPLKGAISASGVESPVVAPTPCKQSSKDARSLCLQHIREVAASHPVANQRASSKTTNQPSLLLETPASSSLFDCLALDRGQSWEHQQKRRRPGRKATVTTPQKELNFVQVSQSAPLSISKSDTFCEGIGKDLMDIDVSTVAGISYDTLSEYEINSFASSTSDDEVRCSEEDA